MLTNKGKYGLKALIHLASIPPGETVQVADIAAQNDIPKKFLDAILLELRNAGLVRSRKGPGGGYALAKSPDEIKIGQAVRALDGPLAPIACASRSAFVSCDNCVDVASCPVRMIMVDVRDAIATVLDGTSLSALAARSRADWQSWVYTI